MTTTSHRPVSAAGRKPGTPSSLPTGASLDLAERRLTESRRICSSNPMVAEEEGGGRSTGETSGPPLPGRLLPCQFLDEACLCVAQ